MAGIYFSLGHNSNLFIVVSRKKKMKQNLTSNKLENEERKEGVARASMEISLSGILN
jgi:hypothetical protein